MMRTASMIEAPSNHPYDHPFETTPKINEAVAAKHRIRIV
jgi:hypothetical protein